MLLLFELSSTMFIRCMCPGLSSCKLPLHIELFVLMFQVKYWLQCPYWDCPYNGTGFLTLSLGIYFEITKAQSVCWSTWANYWLLGQTM
jgi:hypothetical protein